MSLYLILIFIFYLFLFGNSFFHGLIGSLSGSRVVKELEEQHSTLRECIEQLKALESLRVTLVSHLGEAIHEQVGQLMVSLT